MEQTPKIRIILIVIVCGVNFWLGTCLKHSDLRSNIPCLCLHRRFAVHFNSGQGRPALSPRLVAGLAETLEQVGILADAQPKIAIVNKGYRGVEIDGVRILRSGQKRGLTRTLHLMIKRRSAIEPSIGHMKADGRLGRNPFKGALGDALHAVLCGAGHNIRLLLKKLRLLCAQIVACIAGRVGCLRRRTGHSNATGRLTVALFRTDSVPWDGLQYAVFLSAVSFGSAGSGSPRPP
jgi:hypothetical protein